jgi:hypothetical protein
VKTPALLLIGAFAVAALNGGALRAAGFWGGTPIDGIRCDNMEGSVEHIHTHLQLVNRGRSVTIPAYIGMPRPLGSCLYWLHTHTTDGIIHIESPVVRTFTLGQFFDVWGEPLSRSAAYSLRARGGSLSITVNGKAYQGDPRAIRLRDHEEIVIRSV